MLKGDFRVEKMERKTKFRAALIVAALAGVCLLFLLRTFFLEDYFFMSKGIMSDLIRANLPTYYHMYDNIAAGGSFWTWHIGIGASRFTHADVVMDPFTYILFLGGRSHIPDMFIWLFIIKGIATAVTAFLYISHFKIDQRICGFCAILYALSGNLIVLWQ